MMLKTKVFPGVMTMLLAPSLVQSDVLTTVPMQGGMVMPMVSYSAADGQIHVRMPTTVPQLTPLLVSNPGDSFDPADPWFDALDPSARGASFSRRYGFVMDANTDLLPAGTEMWIRKISGPADLKLYRYASSEPKAFEPIFGTDGVTNAMYWNGMMFHPVVAAAPGTNSYAATFEVYLTDTATGEELPNTSSGPLVFDWTNLSDGRPALTLSPQIAVAWPSSTATNWVLESASSPDATSWTPVTNAPVTMGGESCVSLDGNAAQQYFRMRYLP